MRIRPASGSDAEAIASVHVASWQAAYRGQLPDEVLDGLSVARRTDAWRAAMNSGAVGEALLVLEDAGSIRGFAHLCAARDDDAGAGTGEVSAIYLAPSAWGHGAGRALMEEALRHLASLGYVDALLWVLVTNHRARRFYEAVGWVCDGGEKDARIGARRSSRPATADPSGSRGEEAGSQPGYDVVLIGVCAETAFRPCSRTGPRRVPEPSRRIGGRRRYGRLGSLGRPRARSPTMLRWISAEPPQMVSEREKKNSAWRLLTG